VACHELGGERTFTPSLDELWSPAQPQVDHYLMMVDAVDDPKQGGMRLGDPGVDLKEPDSVLSRVPEVFDVERRRVVADVLNHAAGNFGHALPYRLREA
jgi:hypothetical protein